MKAIILAAGKGERLRPLTNKIPKTMIQIGDRPLLEYNIALLKKHGIKDMAINLHHLPSIIKNHFDDGARFGVKISYSFEKELLGTAGAIKKIEDFFDETFLVIHGDNLTNLNLSSLIEFHKEHDGIGTICLYSKEKDIASSSIVLMDENNRIIQFIEKPKNDDFKKMKSSRKWTNAGIYVFEPKILDFIPSKKSFDFGLDLFPKLLAKEMKIYGYPIKGCFWYELGTLEKYKRVKNDVENHKIDLSSLD